MSRNCGSPRSAVGSSYAGALTSLRCPYTRDLRGVELAVLGIPCDPATTNRPGARFGPRALREQSAFFGEAYDPLGQVRALAGATLAADILYLVALARAKRSGSP